MPVSTGEFGISYHNREIDFTKLDTANSLNTLGKKSENKIGLDFKFDVGVGIWFEGVFVKQDIPKEYSPYQQMVNLGVDYTFGIGNGLNIMKEYIWIGISEDLHKLYRSVSFSALSTNYPIGLFDNLMAMIYYDWTNNEWYRFINWQRTYNKISMHLILFWNPDDFNIYQNIQDNNLFSGKGLQLMLVYNY